ncbi:MAG TPA: T9SS type A sorting domain-containing protein [Panacibacter sp.]|nr:T9SS type A sorting domain-containing protein [Panacibacter sp.]HNP45423.1 T9SS type A sorting domain-containing protein [Panacibacter sp.]
MKKKMLPAFVCLLIANLVYAQGGRTDSAFGLNGYTSIDPLLGGPGDQASLHGMIITKAGKLLMYGYSSAPGTSYEAMVQLKNTGFADSKFGVNGTVNYFTALNVPNYGVQALAQQPDGKIITVSNLTFPDQNGFPAHDEAWMARYNVNGQHDLSFGGQGFSGDIYFFDDTHKRFFIQSTAIQADGKILLAGYTLDNSYYPAIIVKRYNADGSPDANFGTTGTFGEQTGAIDFRTVYPGWWNYAAKILVQKNGKILVCGNGAPIGGSQSGFIVARIDSTGLYLDNTFGTNGLAYKTFNSFDGAACNSMAIQKNGKIIAFGVNYDSNVGAVYGMMNFNTNGKLYTGFNSTGMLVMNNIAGNAQSVVLQKDGKIVGAGDRYNDQFEELATLVRVNTNGIIDNSFGTNGIVTGDAGKVSIFKDVAVNSLGNIVAAGDGYSPNGTVFVACRFLSSLSLNMAEANDISNVETKPGPIAAAFIYPNPVKSNAVLTYTIDRDEIVSILLYDMSGHLVQTVLTNATRSGGTNKQQFNIQNSLPAGNYLLTITTKTKQAGIKILKQ